MGYTNYWRRKKPFNDTQWIKIKDEYAYMTENFGNIIIEDQTEKPDEIVFNGLRKGNLDHETFYIAKNSDSYPPDKDIVDYDAPYIEDDVDRYSHNFCKTNRKPYDLAVWHLLTFMVQVAPECIEISRDR